MKNKINLNGVEFVVIVLIFCILIIPTIVAVLDVEVKVVLSDASIGSENKADTGTTWPTADAYASYGAADDLWSESWSATDINDEDFGTVLSASNTDTNPVKEVDHMRITVYYTAAIPEINYSVALPLGLIRFLNCSPDWEDSDVRPDGQTATIAAINATNNGSGTGDFTINLTGVLNTGWTIWASNDSFVNNITLSTSAQTIWSGVAADETKKIWLAANCSYVSANPGQSITMWAE